MAGFERAIVYDMRTKERRWLNDATIFNANHFPLPVTQFPELDPDLDAPMDAEVWSTDVELFRETSPLMGEDIITTWLARMSVYGDPV